MQPLFERLCGKLVGNVLPRPRAVDLDRHLTSSGHFEHL
jgi:hypothetical protein